MAVKRRCIVLCAVAIIFTILISVFTRPLKSVVAPLSLLHKARSDLEVAVDAATPRWCGNSGLPPPPGGVRDFDADVYLSERGLCLSRAVEPQCDRYTAVNGPNATPSTVLFALRSSSCGKIPHELVHNLHIGPPIGHDIDEEAPADAFAQPGGEEVRKHFLAPLPWAPTRNGSDAIFPSCPLGASATDAQRLLEEALAQLSLGGHSEQMLRTVVYMLRRMHATRIFAAVAPKDVPAGVQHPALSVALFFSTAVAIVEGELGAREVAIALHSDVPYVIDLFGTCSCVSILPPVQDLHPDSARNFDAALIGAGSLPSSQPELLAWLDALTLSINDEGIVLVTGCFFVNVFPSRTLQLEGNLHAWAMRHRDSCDELTEAVEGHARWRVGHRHGGMLLLTNATAPHVPLQPAAHDNLVVSLAVNPVRIAEFFFARVLRAAAGSQSLAPDRVMVNVPDFFDRSGERIIVPAWFFKVAVS